MISKTLWTENLCQRNFELYLGGMSSVNSVRDDIRSFSYLCVSMGETESNGAPIVGKQF